MFVSNDRFSRGGIPLVLLVVIVLCCRIVAAQANLETPNQMIVSPTQTAEESAARQAEADVNFRNIISSQQGKEMPAPSGTMNNRLSAFGYMNEGAANEIQAPSPAPAPESRCLDRTVEMPLNAYSGIKETLDAKRERLAKLRGPNVTLGESLYIGEAVKGGLRLRLTLRVTLGNNDDWKTVPLIGDDVVPVSAEADGKTIPVARRDGYIVWPTQRSGELTVTVDFMVPSRGPRGSLEYDFLIARTPVTRFSCRFPVSGLEPRLAAAQETDVTDDGKSSFLEATLRPTTRIHLVGYKDIGDEDEAAAKLFAGSMNLLSVTEEGLDLFTVIRYTILYAGTKRFDIRIPEGMTVISADGAGAFRYTLETEDGRTVLKGETSFPMRNTYEISLRLRRKTRAEQMTFDAPIPHPVGVTRERGWLAVEVPGKLKIAEKQKKDVTSLDIRQLPSEMLASAVSPLIRAYRYHTAAASVTLTYEKLPEKETASASIDRIRAFSVISVDGKMLTDMRIRLRNRLRSELTLALPSDVNVLSVHLDGEAVRPSRDKKGGLILPLKRSEGGERLKQIVLQTVMESRVAPLQMMGTAALSLPAVDLPASSAEWTVYLPAKNIYSRLRGEVETQQYVSEASWFTSPLSTAPIRRSQATQGSESGGGIVDDTGPSGAGVVAVRIELPRSGTRLDYARYWIEKDLPIQISFRYVRGWLRIPAAMLLALLFAVGLVLVAPLPSGKRSTAKAIIGVLCAAAAVGPLFVLARGIGVFGGLCLGAAALLLKAGVLKSLPARISEWSGTFWARFKERDRDPGKIAALRFLAGLGMVFFGLLLLIAAAEFAALLMNPL